MQDHCVVKSRGMVLCGPDLNIECFEQGEVEGVDEIVEVKE